TPHVEHPDQRNGPRCVSGKCQCRDAARMAATRSPYAAGIAKAGDSEGDTTPGTRKLSPTNRNVWGMTNGMRASARRMARSRRQMYTLVTMPKARKLMRMVSQNNASRVTDRLAYAGPRNMSRPAANASGLKLEPRPHGARRGVRRGVDLQVFIGDPPVLKIRAPKS